MTQHDIRTSGIDIHVKPGAGGAWRVAKGEQLFASANYRFRAHAMAFARAVASGSHADMIVHDRFGHITRYQRASLSYPVSLD
jgi:hypothetical protein